MTTENVDDDDPFQESSFYEKGVCGSRKYVRVLYEGLGEVANLQKNSVENLLSYSISSRKTIVIL